MDRTFRFGNFFIQAKCVKTIKSGYVCSLVFSYPHVVTVGGMIWKGLQVWDVVTGTRLRSISDEDKSFCHMDSNGDFLVASEVRDHLFMGLVQNHDAVVFDIKGILLDGLQTISS